MKSKKKYATQQKPGKFSAGSSTSFPSGGCNHIGNKVKVGRYHVLAGGTRYLEPEDYAQADILVPLTEVGAEIWEGGFQGRVKAYPLPDFGGVPGPWEEFLLEIIADLEAGKRVLAFCVGSHGRTGTFLASLIALLETDTKDPISAVRKRHCSQAVESLEQAEKVFELAGRELPEKYPREFSRFDSALYSQPDQRILGFWSSSQKQVECPSCGFLCQPEELVDLGKLTLDPAVRNVELCLDCYNEWDDKGRPDPKAMKGGLVNRQTWRRH